tara:strand:- start:578 stop:817 length:240 start_codon:yes stop_codon:yes gene_type:complete
MIRSINVITGVETQREETQAEKDASAIAVAAELANAPYREIARLEATVTQRRIREMTTDAGKEWVAEVEALIATERAKL